VQLQRQWTTGKGLETGPYEGWAVFFMRNGSGKNQGFVEIEWKRVEDAVFMSCSLAKITAKFPWATIDTREKTKWNFRLRLIRNRRMYIGYTRVVKTFLNFFGIVIGDS